jgi:hypothetical protein
VKLIKAKNPEEVNKIGMAIKIIYLIEPGEANKVEN